MKPLPKIVTAFTLGAMAALVTVSGCSEAATRTLSIFQFQSTETYDGPFKIDTTGLPPDAIETQTKTGGSGKPEAHLKLNMDYEFEIVLRLVGTGENGASTSNESAPPEVRSE